MKKYLGIISLSTALSACGGQTTSDLEDYPNQPDFEQTASAGQSNQITPENHAGTTNSINETEFEGACHPIFRFQDIAIEDVYSPENPNTQNGIQLEIYDNVPTQITVQLKDEVDGVLLQDMFNRTDLNQGKHQFNLNQLNDFESGRYSLQIVSMSECGNQMRNAPIFIIQPEDCQNVYVYSAIDYKQEYSIFPGSTDVKLTCFDVANGCQETELNSLTAGHIGQFRHSIFENLRIKHHPETVSSQSNYSPGIQFEFNDQQFEPFTSRHYCLYTDINQNAFESEWFQWHILRKDFNFSRYGQELPQTSIKGHSSTGPTYIVQ